MKINNKEIKKKIKRKRKDNSQNGDMFSNCRSCNNVLSGWRSTRDTRYCVDCLQYIYPAPKRRISYHTFMKKTIRHIDTSSKLCYKYNSNEYISLTQKPKDMC